VFENFLFIWIAISSVYLNTQQPLFLIPLTSLTTVRFHNRGGKTPPCGHTVEILLRIPPRSEAPIILLSSVKMIHLHNVGSTTFILVDETVASNEVPLNAPPISRNIPNTTYLCSTAL
jgi:hypothetical protein